jgi:hypothetical protein
MLSPWYDVFISHNQTIHIFLFYFTKNRRCQKWLTCFFFRCYSRKPNLGKACHLAGITYWHINVLSHNRGFSRQVSHFHDFFFCSLWNNVYISISVTEELTLPSCTTNLYEQGETLSKEHIEIKKKDSFLDINDIGNKQHHSYLKSSKFSFHPPKNFNNSHEYFL